MSHFRQTAIPSGRKPGSSRMPRRGHQRIPCLGGWLPPALAATRSCAHPWCQLHGPLQLEDLCQERVGDLGDQQTDYPAHLSDLPNHESHGAAPAPVIPGIFTAPIASNTRRCANPVEALAEERARHAHRWTVGRHRGGPGRARNYKSAGGGRFVRSSWDSQRDNRQRQYLQLIRKYGPDRVIGFSPIPAMSMVSTPRDHVTCR